LARRRLAAVRARHRGSHGHPSRALVPARLTPDLATGGAGGSAGTPGTGEEGAAGSWHQAPAPAAGGTAAGRRGWPRALTRGHPHLNAYARYAFHWSSIRAAWPGVNSNMHASSV